MTDPLRWGILGAGNIAATVGADIAAVAGNVLQAVAARDSDRAAAFATAHGVARSYGSYAELVADPDVDVVYVATTHAQHHEHALLCLRAGKPVLVEKAFTLNAAQAAEVVAEARSRGLFCMEAMWVRFHPLVRHVSQLLADGAIGEVIGVRADLSKRFAFDPSHRLFDLATGGGALLDLGVYPATVTWTWLGRPTTVQATGSLSPTGSDLSVALHFFFYDWGFSEIYTSAAGDSPFAALVTGTDGWIALEARIHRGRRLVGHTSAGDEQIDAPAIEGNGYRAELEEVARCLRAGETESPVVPLDDTVGILETLDQARRQLGVRYPADG